MCDVWLRLREALPHGVVGRTAVVGHVRKQINHVFDAVRDAVLLAQQNVLVSHESGPLVLFHHGAGVLHHDGDVI